MGPKLTIIDVTGKLIPYSGYLLQLAVTRYAALVVIPMRAGPGYCQGDAGCIVNLGTIYKRRFEVLGDIPRRHRTMESAKGSK